MDQGTGGLEGGPPWGEPEQHLGGMGPLWAVGRDPAEAPFAGSDCGEVLDSELGPSYPPIEPRFMRAVAKSFKTSTGLGADLWHPRLMAVLSDAA